MNRKCTAQGNPIPPLRDWYDPWYLMGEIIATSIGAIVILVFDIYSHFMGTIHRDDVIHGFKQRMEMAYTTISFYLTELRNAETYNKEVKKHGIQTN